MVSRDEPNRACVHTMSPGGVKSRVRDLLSPVGRLVVDLGIPPAAITFLGFFLSCAAALSLASGRFARAGILLALAGLCDMIDGAAARAGNQASRSGAFLDSTIDRYSETVVLLGALVYYVRGGAGVPDVTAGAVAFIALAGSLMVSYTRARAEAVGVECNMGLAQRPERMVVLIVGALLGQNAFRVALWILAFLSHFTAIQRIRHVMIKART